MKYAVLAVLALAGCAAFDAPPDEIVVVHAGEMWCSSDDPAKCAELEAVVKSLNTPEMDAKIRAAQRGGPFVPDGPTPEKDR